MKKAVFFVLLLLGIPHAAANSFRINEIMYNPEGDDNNKEFIEIFMDTQENLSGWVIADLASNDTLKLLQYQSSNYSIIVEEGFDFTGINASVYSAGATIGNNLDNTADGIFFYTPNTTLVASAQYNGSIANGNGKSMELVDGVWLESIEIRGTPGRNNTAFIPSDSGMNQTGNQTINETGNNSVNQTNSTNQIQSCNSSFRVLTDKDLYNNGESIKINFELNVEGGLIIEYWVEDLSGKIVKSRYNTTNADQKSWTPNIEEDDKSFYIKAILYTNCSSELKQTISEKLIAVKGDPKPTESSITIEELYLGDDNAIEFGKPLRAKIKAYKGDESSSTLEAWIEDLDSGDKISEISRATLYGKFTEYELTIPVQIKTNCKGQFSDGSYTFVAEGFNITQTKEVRIEGVVSSLCPKSDSSDGDTDENSETPQISYELVDDIDEVIAGEEFTSTVKIDNDDKEHKFTLWSYVYRGSKSYSGDREENKIEIDIGPGESRTAELSNTVDDAEPGEYRFKVKILKDSQKTAKEIAKEIAVANPPVKNNSSINLGVAALVQAKNSTENMTEKNGNSTITGSVVYKSPSKKAEGLAIYFIIAALAIIILILLIKYRGVGKKQRGKKTQTFKNTH